MHTIELPDGRTTRPGTPLLVDDPYFRAVLRTLELVTPITDHDRPRVADLGCLEGGFAAGFAQAGYETVGVEGRSVNFEKCQYLADQLALPNLTYVQDDIRNLEHYGEFDAVFCAGVLYHLDEPVAFLQLLGRLARRLLLVQTHYAPTHDDYEFHTLSPLCTNEGKLGRWFEEEEQDPWAAIGNRRSFWLTKRHLLQSLVDAGFPMICEQFDFLDQIGENDYNEKHSRGLFLGIKAAGARALEL